ncbi:hypothetical protein DUGA6_30110 [Duganella sp. HH105]|nr:hypothetical protein DUGA6_30110 [Duganella sp. HH105]
MLLDVCAVERGHLVHQNADGPAVGDNVVHRQQNDVLRVAHAQQARADQWAGGQVERCLRLVLHQPLRLGIALRMRQVRQIGALQRQLQRRHNHLHRRAVHAGKARAQGFMAAYDLVQRALQRRRVELSVQADRRRNIVERAARLELVEEPQALLRERQRHAFFAFDRRQGCRGQATLCRCHARQQAGDRRCFEHHPQRQFDFECATDLRHQLRRQQRMAPQREKVIVHAYVVEPEHAGPDARHDLLGRRARCDVAVLAARHVRRRQGFAIHFAVRRQWHLLQHHEVRRHHVLRQRRQQGGAQPFRFRQLCVVVRDQIRDQPLVARHVFTRQHQCFAHRLQRRQRGLDFTELDAEAAQLDLMVDAPQVFDAAILQITGQVARLVHAAARNAERIGYEFVRRQVATVDVTACQAIAGDMQLARNAHRHRVQPRIENMNLRIGDRTADVQDHVGGMQHTGSRHYGIFGRTVIIHQRVSWPGSRSLSQSVATDQQVLQRRQLIAARHRHLRQWRRQEADVQARFAPPAEQILRIFCA